MTFRMPDQRRHQLERARARSDRLDRLFTWLLVACLLAIIAFWTAVIVIAWHFLGKAW